jgi:hypothetical protein
VNWRFIDFFAGGGARDPIDGLRRAEEVEMLSRSLRVNMVTLLLAATHRRIQTSAVGIP